MSQLALTRADDSYLLGLPQDVLHVLLSRLPPKSLLSMSLTCKILQDELKHEAIWRGSYVNRYLWDGAASFGSVKDEVKVLAQPCMREGGKGWKKESLSREGMLE